MTEYSNSPANKKYEIFIKIITDAVAQNTPKRSNNKFSSKNNPVPWWDQECNELKKMRKEAFKKWVLSCEMKDGINYRRIKALTQKKFKMKKRQSFRNFAETINFSTNVKYTWNKCKIFKNKWVHVEPCITSNFKSKENLKMALDKLNPPFVPILTQSTFRSVKKTISLTCLLVIQSSITHLTVKTPNHLQEWMVLTILF